MVGHEHIGVDAAIAHVAVFLEPFQITTVVFVDKKAGLAIVAALDDVQRDASGGKSRSSWHDDYLPLILGVIQEENRGQTTFFCSTANEQKKRGLSPVLLVMDFPGNGRCLGGWWEKRLSSRG